jgi:hypothetical protein
MSDPVKLPRKVDVPNLRYTTPAPFAALSCMFGHSYRVVLERNQPIALECSQCTRTWETKRVEPKP